MKTDRELLELAAKASGHTLGPEWNCYRDCILINGTGQGDGDSWNPLTDDGDALRLAVAVGLNVEVHRLFPFCGWQRPWVEVRGFESRRILAEEMAADNSASLQAATRRAIVRAAAEIGRSMP